MEKWTRHMRSYDINGFASSGGTLEVTSTPYVYKTDEALEYSTPKTSIDSRYYIPKVDGTYNWRTTWSKQSGAPPGGNQAMETRVVVTVLGSDVQYCASHRAGPAATIDSLSFSDETCSIWDDYTDVYVAFDHKMQLQNFGTGYDATTENNLAGNYDVELTAPSGSYDLATFEFRVYGTLIQTVSNLPDETDPNHPEGIYNANRRLDSFALPPSSFWTASGNGTLRVTLTKGGSTVYQKFLALAQGGTGSSPHHNGYFGGWLWAWDGRNPETGVVSEGSHTLELAALLPVEGGVQTYSKKTDTLVVYPYEANRSDEDRRAELEDDGCGNQRVRVNYHGQGSTTVTAGTVAGSSADMSIDLGFRGPNSLRPPASLGYGWGLSRQERMAMILTDYNDYIRYEFNAGQFEVWKIDGSSYLAIRPDNKSVLTKNQDDSLLLTFPNGVEKQFHPLDATIAPGTIEWQKDRNGNTTYFHYDTNDLLTAMSDEIDGSGDPDGRITRLSYLNPTVDPQPYKVTSEVRAGGVLQGQRDTTFSFHSTTNISEGYLEGRISSVENAAGETESYLYYADDQDFRYGRIYRVLDDRGHIVQELDYHNDQQVRVKKETTFYDPGTGVTPEMTREYEYGTVTVMVEYAPYGWAPRLDGYTQTVTSTDHTGRSNEPVRVKKYFLDTDRNLVKIEETIGEETNVTEMERNDSANPDRVTKRIDPNLKYQEYTYNSLGNVLTSRNKEGEITTIAYKSSDPNLVESITRPEVTVPDPQNPGQTITEQYMTTFGYDAKGNLNSITDANNRTTYFRLRNGIDHAATDGQIWKVVNRRWDGSPSTEDDHATIFTYYSNGNLESVETPAGPGAHPGTRVTFEYDVFGNVNKITDLLGNEWTSVFDDVNRLIEQEDARGKKSYFDYTDGLLTGVGMPPNEGPSGTQSFDIGGSRQARLSVFSHDYRGRVTEVESHTSSSTTETRAAYDYTGFSEMHKLIRLINTYNKTTEWSYDELGRVVEMVDDLGRSTTRTYEPFCVEFQQTTARGIVSTHTFDELCRPKTMLAPSRDFAYSYDELGRLIEITQDLQDSRYNDNGAKYSISIFGGKYSSGDAPVTNVRFGSARYTPTSKSWVFEYDSLDRLTKVVYPDGEEVTYSYGHEGELLEVSDADGKITKYEYNNDLSVRKVVLERGGVDVAEFVYTYDAGGRVEKIVYPDGIEVHFDDGGSPAQSGWNPNGQLTYIRYLKDDGMSGLEIVRSYQYTYDDSGNRTQMIESNGTPSQDIEWQYRYDWFDRLVQVKRGVGGATPSVQREYTFDESDNRTYVDDYVNNRTLWYTYKTVGSGSAIKYSDEIAEVFIASGTGKRAPADINDFTSLEKFVSDDDGNIIQRSSSSGRINYEWDDSNNLLSVNFDNGNSTQNVYDPGSIREEAIKNSGERVKSFFSGLPTINEDSTTGGNDISYFLGHQLLGFEKNGNKYYFVTDGLSSVRVVLDSSGNEVAVYEHDEYGNELSSSGSLASPKTFVGGLGVHDDTAESQLLYMRRRHYDPVLGRFINQDPIGLRGGPNLFSYGANNPVTFVDASGLNPNLQTSHMYGTSVIDGSFRIRPMFILGGGALLGTAEHTTTYFRLEIENGRTCWRRLTSSRGSSFLAAGANMTSPAHHFVYNGNDWAPNSLYVGLPNSEFDVRTTLLRVQVQIHSAHSLNLNDAGTMAPTTNLSALSPGVSNNYFVKNLLGRPGNFQEAPDPQEAVLAGFPECDSPCKESRG